MKPRNATEALIEAVERKSKELEAKRGEQRRVDSEEYRRKANIRAAEEAEVRRRAEMFPVLVNLVDRYATQDEFEGRVDNGLYRDARAAVPAPRDERDDA